MIGYKDIYKADCLAYIPPVYSDILEFKALAKCFNLELERTGTRLEEVENNFFIDSLNEYGCERWEKMLDIKTNYSNSVEDRRFAIKAKLLGLRPYTYERLKYFLINLIGEHNFILEMDYSKNHLTCKLNLGVKARMDSVKDLIEKTVPLNISTEVVLLYNTHKMLASKTHKELGKHTHTELREGSIV
ncbi:putative phage tail protein [Peptostreptococcus anaerobius]|uniref:putative phage tail protein n=1 Tax=Peptostreptococcus anaerobius TaxID=1261 RepID=UPI0029045169|nr:putative phage tail protein [Peptostreptococcus anaerobius]MDU1174727.1 putative phage tail protein [Peptostreptococcus anaerobius]MDU1233882.1 putative phage tail protein [Peptostreptococcus anaerobius]